MAHPERASIGRSLMITILVMGVLALGGLVAYLYSDINHHRYRLTVRNNMLEVEQGLFFPTGFGPYQPTSPTLRETYAPLPIPDEVTLHGPGFLGTTENFDERADLDRALFNLLSGWAKQRLDAADVAQLDLATTYVRRSEALPGISEQQRGELRALRANLAYQSGNRILDGIVASLQRAQEQFRQAIALGSPHATEAQRWITEIDRRITLYRDLPPATKANTGSSQ